MTQFEALKLMLSQLRSKLLVDPFKCIRGPSSLFSSSKMTFDCWILGLADRSIRAHMYPKHEPGYWSEQSTVLNTKVTLPAIGRHKYFGGP